MSRTSPQLAPATALTGREADRATGTAASPKTVISTAVRRISGYLKTAAKGNRCTPNHDGNPGDDQVNLADGSQHHGTETRQANSMPDDTEDSTRP